VPSTAEARAAYLLLSFLQARAGRSLVRRLGGDPAGAWVSLTAGELEREYGLGAKDASELARLRETLDVEGVLRELAGRGISVLTPADAAYPHALREIPDPPPALFVDGALPVGEAVAVVGSRKPSPGGLEVARRLGRALAGRGVCVISGLALGVDAAAHEGALLAGGPTVGVLGCGIDVVYPRVNARLFGEVRAAGGIVSEYYLGEPPLAWRFPARNRIIAGLARVVVVVEAAERSGALITARHALESGRDVWAVPGPVGFAGCRGSNRLLADGAGVLWDIGEFVEAVAPGREGAAEEAGGGAPPPPGLPAGEAAVLGALGFEPAPADEVAQRCGLAMGQVLSALSMLELKGYVVRDAGGGFVRRADL